MKRPSCWEGLIRGRKNPKFRTTNVAVDGPSKKRQCARRKKQVCAGHVSENGKSSGFAKRSQALVGGGNRLEKPLDDAFRVPVLTGEGRVFADPTRRIETIYSCGAIGCEDGAPAEGGQDEKADKAPESHPNALQ